MGMAQSRVTDAAIIAAAKEWLPKNPEAVLRTVIAWPESSLAKDFKARVAQLAKIAR